jgi:6-pyruvoyltetrahydropterin/6-carboxytetrahydropterin synthase
MLNMFRLTREVRFAINPAPDEQLAQKPTNSYGGYPSLRGFGAYLILQITVAGEPDNSSNYLLNIKQIDAAVRNNAIPFLTDAVRGNECRFGSAEHSPRSSQKPPAELTPEHASLALFNRLHDAWPAVAVQEIRLSLSPFLSYSAVASELPMVRLSQKFEFSATHRLHNPSLSDEENREIFGKCNNPHGHGHNYELQVTLRGTPNPRGILIDLPDFERIVAAAVIDRFDHKNLNLELPEFRNLIPTVENIAMVIHRLLKPRFDGAGVMLASVTVWETPKTWCEYAD